MARKPPTPSTVKRLFAFSGNQCAEPECQKSIISEDGKVVLGEICHIAAAEPKGPRFDVNMDNEYRRSFDNLLLLCESHHKIVDASPEEFPIEKLKEWKKLHEESNKSKELKIDDNEVKEIISKNFNNNSGIINKVNSTGDNQQVNITNTINHNKGDNIKKSQLTKIAEIIGIFSAIIGVVFAIWQFIDKEKREDSSSYEVENVINNISSEDKAKLNFLVKTSKEAKELSDSTLMNNQKAFIEALNNPAGSDIELKKLFNYQKYRSKFGELTAKLSAFEDSFNDSLLITQIKGLNKSLKIIEHALYKSAAMDGSDISMDFGEEAQHLLEEKGFDRSDTYILGAKKGLILFITSNLGKGEKENEICKIAIDYYLEKLRFENQIIGMYYGEISTFAFGL